MMKLKAENLAENLAENRPRTDSVLRRGIVTFLGFLPSHLNVNVRVNLLAQLYGKELNDLP